MPRVTRPTPPRNEDTNGAVSQRLGANASAGGLAKLPHVLLTPGAVVAISTKPAPRSGSTRSARG
jgi:hypothetical protein